MIMKSFHFAPDLKGFFLIFEGDSKGGSGYARNLSLS